MGAWGYEPDQNDSAWDLFGDGKPFKGRTIYFKNLFAETKSITTQDRWERVGALILALRQGWKIHSDVIGAGVADLTMIRRDKWWFTSWRKPKDTMMAADFWIEQLLWILHGDRPYLGEKPSLTGIVMAG